MKLQECKTCLRCIHFSAWHSTLQGSSTTLQPSQNKLSTAFTHFKQLHIFERSYLVSLLVDALSPVNHKGLHQGWIQTSLCLQVINFTSHHTTYHVFLAYLYSADTQHGNLPLAGWPILFCRPTQEPCVSHSQHRKTPEWTGRVEISKEAIPGSTHSMYGNILTYSRL